MSKKIVTEVEANIEGLNAIKVRQINDEISNLLGEVLTIVDAVLEGEKNNATKDLIRGRFSNKFKFFNDLAWRQLEKEGNGHAPRYSWENELVPFDCSKHYNFRLS